MTTPPTILIGRSSSHFTRVARIFALELGVPHGFQVVRDLLSTAPEDYGGNPALRIPVLQTARGAWFGALNICRELQRMSTSAARVVWPEDLREPLLADALELTTQAMATEVGLVMGRLGGTDEQAPHLKKMRESLLGTLAWLEANVEAALAGLPPERDLSFLEVTLLCLVEHLEFREVLPTSGYAALTRFCGQFGARSAAAATRFRFDPV